MEQKQGKEVTLMGCGNNFNCGNSCSWIIILIIILLLAGGNGCGGCGCDNGCGC